MKKLIYIFLFIQIFTNAFAISSVLTPAFAVSIVLFGIGVLRRDVFIDTKEPFLLCGFYFILLFSYLTMSTGEKCFNHLLMWSVPAFLYYYTFKRQMCMLFTVDEFEHKALKVITLSTLTASSFAVFEFLAVNVLGVSMSFIPRGTVEDYTPLALDSIRARSFMEESGQFSFFLEAFAPLSVYWIHRNVKRDLLEWLMYAVMAVALFVSFSAAGYALFLIGGVIFVFYQMKNSKSASNIVGILFMLLIVALIVFVIFPDVYESIRLIIEGKLDPESSSHHDRANRFVALQHFQGIAILFGYGPAAFSTLRIESFVSFYLGVLMSTGIIGTLFLVLFFLRQYHYLFKLKNYSLKITLIISLTMVLLHLAFVDNIYTPWLWVLLSFIYFARTKQIAR
ncbi:MAG: hypothetical protein IJ190_06000 [Prevotella sp.]|nr:hypothetical protein [Prevotella sp.]